jgi:hypothetical protein
MKHEPITPAEYRAFQQAYDFFNRQLFGGRLPHVLVLVTLWYPERFRLWFPRRARYSPFFKYINPDCFLSFRVAELFPLPTERSEGADGKGKSDTGSRIWFKRKAGLRKRRVSFVLLKKGSSEQYKVHPVYSSLMHREERDAATLQSSVRGLAGYHGLSGQLLSGQWSCLL